MPSLGLLFQGEEGTAGLIREINRGQWDQAHKIQNGGDEKRPEIGNQSCHSVLGVRVPITPLTPESLFLYP